MFPFDMLFSQASRRTLVAMAAWFACAVMAQAPPAASPADPRFAVLEFRIEGNTVLPSERIERTVYPFMGEQRSAADVEAARVALEAEYRFAGYGTVVVDTPEQRIVDGVVTLQVIEAPISRLRVVGARYYSQGRLLQKVPALAEGEVPNFQSVTAQLGAVQTADRRVTPLLRPGKQPGTTEVDLTVEDKLPLHGSLEISDKYSANTTRTRLQATLRYDNLWQREHSIGLQAQTSPEDINEVQVWSLSYTMPRTDGLWILSAISSNSNTVAGVGDTSVFGRGSIFGLRRLLVLQGTDTWNHNITLGVDYKDFKESVSVGANEGFDTPIHYLPFSAVYSNTITDKQGFWQAGGGITFAVRGFGSKETQFQDKRFMAQSNFSILKGNLSRTHKLAGGLTLHGAVEGQFSGQALISNEQFVAGGVDSVRGYLDATAVGDKALRGSIELRSGNLAPQRFAWLGGLTAHAFIDGAALYLNDPLPQQTHRFGLLSTGFGLRVQALQYARLALDLAWALRDAGTVGKGDFRVHASGVVEF